MKTVYKVINDYDVKTDKDTVYSGQVLDVEIKEHLEHDPLIIITIRILPEGHQHVL
jgi:chromatin remodeling complex protein RSC6